MSSFCGAVSITEKYLNPGLLDKMALTLNYWNAQSVQVLQTNNVGMAHLSSDTTQKSTYQLLAHETSEYIICGDWRLDNRADLQRQFNLPQETTDQCIILAAYKKWSEDCAGHLLGDFSFAIWDKRKNSILCVRDHIGVRPFYYFYEKGIFAFASEKKALFCIPGFMKKINYSRLAEILTHGVIGTLEYTDETEYLNVFQLKPAHTLSFKSGKLTVKKYWELSLDQEIGKMSLNESVEGFREHLDQAVKCRVPSIGAVGAELSGGLDSSILTAFAVKYRPDLNTFSSIIDSNDGYFLSERPYAEKLCDYLDIKNCHFVSNENFDFEKELKKCVHILDGIGYGLGNLFKAPIVQKAEQAGCRVIISGFGGDECASYSGTKSFNSLRNSRGYKEILKRILHSSAPFIMGRYRELRNPHSTRIPLSIIMQPNLSKTGVKLSSSYLSYATCISRSRDKGERTHLLEGLVGKRSEYLRTVVSTMSLYSKKTTYVFPLLDTRLLNFMLSVPSKYRYHAGINRYLMRQAAVGMIPDDLRLRKDKAGFIFPAPYYEFVKFHERKSGRLSPLIPLAKKLNSKQKQYYLNSHLERGAFLFNSACDIFLELL